MKNEIMRTKHATADAAWAEIGDDDSMIVIVVADGIVTLTEDEQKLLSHRKGNHGQGCRGFNYL